LPKAYDDGDNRESLISTRPFELNDADSNDGAVSEGNECAVDDSEPTRGDEESNVAGPGTCILDDTGAWSADDDSITGGK
jgi:hypothetical protein